MLRSLLVPLDGSKYSEHALPVALSIARRAKASLQLVQVHVPFSLLYADSMAPGAFEVESHVMEQERAYLEDMAKRLAACSSIPISSALLEGPLAAEMLQGHAATTGVDLIVMATHGRGPMSRLWLGSIADEMARRATTPILLVRPHEEAVDLASEPPLRHFLIPLDGSPEAEHILGPAKALGGIMQADFTLLRVYGPAIDAAPPRSGTHQASETGIELLQGRAKAYLNQLAENLRQEGFRVQAQAIDARSPASAILETAQNLTVNVIALETHGRHGLPRLLLGSVADKVIRGASTPVLVHRLRSA